MDITKCTGEKIENGQTVKCPLRESCRRFIEDVDKFYQSWIDAYFDLRDNTCSMYYPWIKKPKTDNNGR